MTAASRSEPPFYARRDAIADVWYRALAPTGFAASSPASVRRRLASLVDRVIALLLDESFDRNAGEAIGTAIVELRYMHPDALRGTQEVLTRELLVGLDAAPALYGRLGELLGAIAGGFVAASRLAILEEQEQIRGALFVAHRQVEEAHAARLQAEEAQQRLGFLADASAQLASSLDYQATLERVARLAVPDLADGCLVDLLLPDGSVAQVAVAHRDPAQEEAIRQTREALPPRLDAQRALSRVLATGRPVFEPYPSEEWLQSQARTEGHRQIMRDVGSRSYMCVPLLARGRVLGAMSFLITESERHYTPLDLTLAEELAHRAALAVDNARLYEEARQAVRVRDEFLSSVSHDLKNPLVTVKGWVQLLQGQISALGTDQGRRWVAGLARVDATASRMAEQIDTLLDLARLQAGQPLSLDRQSVDLVALAREAVGEYRHTSPAHHIEIETALGELVGDWDRGRIARVLDNLLSNAVKYSAKGSEVLVRLRRAEDGGPHGEASAVVDVRDQGIGIPAADIPRLFTRFHRAANVGDVEGTGLGLAGARQIVEQHGGVISVESEDGRGTTVTIVLPLAAVDT